MSDVAIIVENLGKSYIIGKQLKPAETLYKCVKRLAAAPFSWLSEQVKGPNPDQILWALKDVSFEVKRGDVVGIIGRNGAGKSTLLKILSRITEPTEGFAELHGRIGSLLEIGTGMHPELTGRENIYMNATLLGMTRREVDAKFDEIVDFSGVEKFIDTPVKRYSSGMNVRLGFAIAAHLEPEILIVDEVLAVGDAEFQKKCLGKMGEVAKDGRTVLFVSHNMTSVGHLCNTGIVLGYGRVSFQGDASSAILHYRNAIDPIRKDHNLADIRHRQGSGALRFVRYRIENHRKEDTGYVISGKPFRILLSFQASEDVKNLNVGIGISTSEGFRLTSLASSLLNKEFPSIPRNGTFVFDIPRLPLNLGSYSILLDARQGMMVLDRIEDAFTLTVKKGDFWGSGRTATIDNPLLFDFGITVESELNCKG